MKSIHKPTNITHVGYVVEWTVKAIGIIGNIQFQVSHFANVVQCLNCLWTD